MWLGDFTSAEADSFLADLMCSGQLSRQEVDEVYRRVGTRAIKLMNLRDAKFPAARKANPGLNPADWLYKQAEPAADSQLSAFLDPAVDPGNYPKRVQLLRNLIDGKGVCAPSSSAEFKLLCFALLCFHRISK